MYRASGLSGLLLAMRNADLTGSMRHWFEYPAYFAFGSLLALWQQRFAEHGGVMVLVLLPLSAVLFFGLKLQHTAGLLLLPRFWSILDLCAPLSFPGCTGQETLHMASMYWDARYSRQCRRCGHTCRLPGAFWPRSCWRWLPVMPPGIW